MVKTVLVELEKAETIAEKHTNLFWDGWNLVLVNPTIDGFQAVSGIWWNGQWATKNVVEPDTNGRYKIPAWYNK